MKGLNKKTFRGVVQKKKTSRIAFEYLLEEEMFSEFKSLDWIYYFQMKYFEANNMHYQISDNKRAWTVEHSIYKSVMKEYTPRDIKLMIDFIFDSNQDIKDKKQCGSYLLSSKWIDSIYRTACLWREGQYFTRREMWDKQNRKSNEESTKTKFKAREWTTDTDVDIDESVSIGNGSIRL